MGSINKVKLLQQSEETYDISPSPNGTLDSDWYVSEDSSTENAQYYDENISKIENTDDNKTIFSKITGMIRNIRYLFNRIGKTPFESDTVSNAIVDLNNICDDKADIQHSHTINDLPVTTELENSSSSIPTSEVVYNVNKDLNDKYDAYSSDMIISLTSSMPCGAIQVGTFIDNMNIGDILKRILRKGPNPEKYEDVKIATWNDVSDVVSFFNTYNADNQWSGLKLGNYIEIKTYNLQENTTTHELEKDGYYYTEWVIAGFDCEKRDSHDNGYGICLIPKTPLIDKDGGTIAISYNDPYPQENAGYKNSNIHRYLNDYWVKALEVLGDHLVDRDVRLSNEVEDAEILNGSWVSSDYIWTKAKLTLLSIGQVTNKFNSHTNEYDDGESDYYLPIFEQIEYPTKSMETPYENSWWVRNLVGRFSKEYSPDDFRMGAYAINDYTGTIEKHFIDESLGLMPMIYLNKIISP